MMQASVPNVSSVFYTYVASVFILMLHMFHTYVISVLSGCCICFAMAFQVFFRYFLQVFQMHVSSVSSAFRRMLQMFHLDVSKVDRVLHMLQWRRWLADNALL
jgi:sensor histidine kinase YesM